MAGGTGNFDNYAQDLCRGALFCMDSSECMTEKLDKCKKFPSQEFCFAYFLAKEVKKNLPRVYEEWKKIIERQEEDGNKHGVNAIIIYGLAKIHGIRGCIIIPALGDDMVERIKKMELPELMVDLEPLLDYDLKSLMCGKSEENQLAVLRIFKMFYDGTKQPAIL